MLIVHVTNTDPAGCVYNFVRAMNTFTPHRVRLISTQAIPEFDFPSDILYLYDSGDEIQALLEQADVIHLHKVNEDFEFEFELQRGVRKFNIRDYIKGKKIVYHVHGAPSERSQIEFTAAKYSRQWPLLCSTPDLEEIYKPHHPKAQYWPNLVPINDVRYIPRATDEPLTGQDGTTKKYIVFQSGTHSILKNMHIIRDVMERVGADLPAIFLHTSPEQIQPLDACLRHKRVSHIVFDHMEGYYGLSSLEAMSMGKPTIAGLSQYTVEAICRFFGVEENRLPWIRAATEEQLEERIRRLLTDHDLRRGYGLRSRKFMEEVWSDAAVAQRMADFYQSL